MNFLLGLNDPKLYLAYVKNFPLFLIALGLSRLVLIGLKSSTRLFIIDISPSFSLRYESNLCIWEFFYCTSCNSDLCEDIEGNLFWKWIWVIVVGSYLYLVWWCLLWLRLSEDLQVLNILLGLFRGVCLFIMSSRFFDFLSEITLFCSENTGLYYPNYTLF